MKRSDPLDSLIRHRLDALVRDLPFVREGSARALHRTRVASRRMREALPFLDLKLATLNMGRVRRRTRGLTRALGEVRELDVALGILDEFSATDPERQRVIERVRASVRRQRDTHRKAMLHDLEKLEPERLVDELSDRLDADETGEPSVAWRTQLAVQLVRRAQRARDAVAAAGVMFLPERLHAVRIALKKLRYGLELADETGLARTKIVLKRLKGEQERLGRLHDLDVLGGLIRQVRKDAPPGASANELGAVLDELEGEMRRLHGQFVAERDELQTICARVEAIGTQAGSDTVADAS